MTHVTLANATDLSIWSERLDSQGILPHLIRRLIQASSKDIFKIGFPANEGIQLGGYDGILSVGTGNTFVPKGISAWELSTRRNIKQKADTDYEKRCKSPLEFDPGLSTFIFVTSRRWNKKAEWAHARQSEGFWKDVRAYDADDIETWLELSPVVHTWFSSIIGKQPEGVIDIGNFWLDWSEATTPNISPRFLLSV